MEDNTFLIIFVTIALSITFWCVVLGNSFDYIYDNNGGCNVKLNGSDLVRNAMMTFGVCVLSSMLGYLVAREENTSIPTKKDYLKGDAKMIIEKSLKEKSDTTYKWKEE